jgi:hypothetical protein
MVMGDRQHGLPASPPTPDAITVAAAPKDELPDSLQQSYAALKSIEKRLAGQTGLGPEQAFVGAVAVHRVGATTVEAVTSAQHAVAQRIKDSTNREVDDCLVPPFVDSLIRWGQQVRCFPIHRCRSFQAP